MELGILRSRVGIALLGAAVFDDILVLLALSIFTALVSDVGPTGLTGVIQILLQMLGYFAISITIGMKLLPRLARYADRLPINQGLYLFTLIVALVYAWSAEALGGIAAITGAFLAGLFLNRIPQRERIIGGVSTIAYTLFVPVFFANIGLQTNARNLSGNLLWMTLAIIVVAVISKLLGCGLGARMGGMKREESLLLGAGMISRGEVGLIVATLGLTHHLISDEIFSMTVITVIVVTLLTPILLHRLAQNSKSFTGTEPELTPE
jgi:Kef-type K+ transport system membrane component KefB